MGKLHYLKSIQKIPASLEKTWEFFSNPKNLAEITPSFLNLKVTNEIYGDKAYPGQVLTYTVKPLLGISIEWMTEITHVEHMKMFVDEQRKGPYKLWHHQHHFKEIEGGVEMTDLVHYRVPFGPLGNMAHPLIVKNKLRDIFLYRFGRVNEIFGSWPGEDEMNLEIK
jgi:ligand-binding SRPBCC domain-containing protein